MKMGFSNIVRCASLAGVATIALAPVAALAQEETSDEDDTIVVTGTLIRGTEAVGAQTIAVDTVAITQQAANSTNQVLGLIPQIANTFNGRFEGDPRGVSAGITITKPNLRDLPGFNSASGGVTLVLMDGFRFAPVGVGQSSIDVDIIPAAVLEGVDVLTDGGTSLYGADAVAGVINFRTMRSFDGLKVDATYGLGDTISAHEEYDASITAGTSWDTGNAYVSFSYAHRDLITNGDVEWADGTLYDAAGTPRGNINQCPDPVGATNTYIFLPIFGGIWTDDPRAGVGRTPIGTPCDGFAGQTYLPKQDRYSVFGALSQELGDGLDLRVTGYYTKRDQELSNSPRGFTTAAETPVFPANPVPFQTLTIDAGTSFSFGPHAAYEDVNDKVGFETWGITPELTLDLPADFQARWTTHFGQSTNDGRFAGVNGVLAQALVTAGDIDPFDVASSSDAAIAQVLDWETAQDTTHQLVVSRVVVDGSMFALPGGDARIALGTEYKYARAKTRVLSGPMGDIDSLPYRSAGQHAISLFGEVVLPFTDWVEVSGSVRHDHYSDFGTTTNPNIGVSFTPTDWLKIYGHWNTSFNAPTALDQLAQAIGRFTGPIYSPGGNVPVDPFGQWDGTGTRAFIAEGPNSGLDPQEAESWAVGAEIAPTSGLRIGGNFYSIDFTNILGAVNPVDNQTYELFPELYIYNPSPQFFAQFLAELANGDALAQQVTADEIALLVDRRTSNISSAKLEGIDFNINYDTATSFGSLAFGVNANFPTKGEVSTGSAVQNLRPLGADFRGNVFGAANIGNFSSRVTVNYTGKIENTGPDNTGATASAPAFVQTNLFLGYDFDEGSGALAGTSFRIIVDNVFNEKPTSIRRNSENILSYVNWTLGRVFKFGISREF